MKRILLSILFLAGFASLQAQEAFYIYRNDGDFNGFFFDQVQSINVSKFDLAGNEHDVYVVQEIQTPDSLYRIPLAAIDSVGFQQPEIILSNNFASIMDEDWPFNCYDYFFSSDDGYTLTWLSNDPTKMPQPGTILHFPFWKSYSDLHPGGYYQDFDENAFVGKVVEVRPTTFQFSDPALADEYRNMLAGSNGAWYDVVCEPITDLSDIFEQFITVEQLGTDANGNARHRMAGSNRIARRVEGNRDLSILNLNGSFPFSRGNDDFEATMTLDLSLQIRANVAYEISRRRTFIGVTLKEDAECGVRFFAKANLGEVMSWELAGVPIYFPSVLPIFQLNPGPQAFIKTTGDITLTLGSPKFAYHGTQTFHIGTDAMSGSCSNQASQPGDPDNGWSLDLSLNGSIQGGANFPMKLETNTWVKKALHASVGADVYVGPRVSAAFSIDPVAAAKGELYNTLKNTNVTISPICTVFEANATYSVKGGADKKDKFFEGQRTFFDMKLSLFPEFQKTQVTQAPEDGIDTGFLSATIFPRGNSVPFVLGLGLYNADKELVSLRYDAATDGQPHMYSFFNTFAELPYEGIRILDGTNYLVPVISAFGYDVPAWGHEIEVKRTLIPYIWSHDGDRNTNQGYTNQIRFEKEYGEITIGNIRPGDRVDFILTDGLNKDEIRTYERPAGDPDYIWEVNGYEEDNKEPQDKTVFRDDPEWAETPDFETKHEGADKAYIKKFTLHNMYRNTRKETGGPSRPGMETKNVIQHFEWAEYSIQVTRKDGRVIKLDDVLFFAGLKQE